MTRVDTSIATFFMVHHDLFVESLYDFGSDAQQDRYLDDASNLRTTGAFALTEPDHAPTSPAAWRPLPAVLSGQIPTAAITG